MTTKTKDRIEKMANFWTKIEAIPLPRYVEKINHLFDVINNFVTRFFIVGFAFIFLTIILILGYNFWKLTKYIH